MNYTSYIFILLTLIFCCRGHSQATICHRHNKVNPTQEPANGPRCRIIGEVFYFEGAVTEDLFYELRDYAPQIKTIELNSYGGHVVAAYPTVRFLYHAVRLSSLWVDSWSKKRDSLKIGNVDREKNLDLLAQQFVEVREETEKFFSQLILYGLSPDLIHMYRQRPETTTWFEDGNFMRTDNWIISNLQLAQFNVVQEFDYRETVPEN